MRIDLNHKLQNVADIGSSEQSSVRAQNNAVKTNFADDRAELSPDQVRAQSLASQANDLPEVRQEKVNALGQAIQQGRYNVTPEQTAEAMMEDMRTAA